MYFFQHSPSLDGASLELFAAASASLPYSNVLWYYKLGPHDSYDRFQFNFAYTVNHEVSSAQALEFDTFQFIRGVNYTFGTQCDLGTGKWEVFDDGHQEWRSLGINCTPVAGDWYEVTWSFQRSSNTLTYESFQVRQYNSSGNHLISQNTYNVGVTVNSAPTPPHYADNLGVQFQIDLGPHGGMMPMWVDKVSLTASDPK
jgi:hypothetical protein